MQEMLKEEDTKKTYKERVREEELQKVTRAKKNTIEK